MIIRLIYSCFCWWCFLTQNDSLPSLNSTLVWLLLFRSWGDQLDGSSSNSTRNKAWLRRKQKQDYSHLMCEFDSFPAQSVGLKLKERTCLLFKTHSCECNTITSVWLMMTLSLSCCWIVITSVAFLGSKHNTNSTPSSSWHFVLSGLVL